VGRHKSAPIELRRSSQSDFGNVYGPYLHSTPTFSAKIGKLFSTRKADELLLR